MILVITNKEHGLRRATVTDYMGVMFTCAVHLNNRDHAIAADVFTQNHVVLTSGRYRVDTAETKSFRVGAK